MKMNQKNSNKIRLMAVVGLMAALVFVFTYIGIDIPSPLAKTKLHLGNVMCLLAGLLFGGVPGGLAAGIGSAIFDLMDPLWAPGFWVTFINKFAMGFVAGILYAKLKINPKARCIIAALAGSLTYSFLYISKSLITMHIVEGVTWKAAFLAISTTKLPVTLVNGLIAVVCSVLLAAALRPALKKAGLFRETMTKE